MRSTRTNTLRSQAGGAGARIAIASATPTKNRLSASEPSSSQRDEPRVIAGAYWAMVMGVLRSAASGSNTIEPRSVRLATANGAPRAVEVAVEPGDADDEAERGAAGERRDARPGRRELPVEQDARQAPQRHLLPRQRAG